MKDVGELRLDDAEEVLWMGERKVNLTATQYRLLTHFIKYAGKWQRTQELAANQQIWEVSNVSTAGVRMHIMRLRKRIDPGNAHKYIDSDKTKGFRLIARIATSLTSSVEVGQTPSSLGTEPQLSGLRKQLNNVATRMEDYRVGFFPRAQLRRELAKEGVSSLCEWNKDRAVLGQLQIAFSEWFSNDSYWLRRCLLYTILPGWCCVRTGRKRTSNTRHSTSADVLEHLEKMLQTERISGACTWILQCLRLHCEIHGCGVPLDACRRFLNHVRAHRDGNEWFSSFVLSQLVGLSGKARTAAGKELIENLIEEARLTDSKDPAQEEWALVQRAMKTPWETWVSHAESDIVLGLLTLSSVTQNRKAQMLWLRIMSRFAKRSSNSFDRSTCEDVLIYAKEKVPALRDFVVQQERVWDITRAFGARG